MTITGNLSVDQLAPKMSVRNIGTAAPVTVNNVNNLSDENEAKIGWLS